MVVTTKRKREALKIYILNYDLQQRDSARNGLVSRESPRCKNRKKAVHVEQRL